MKDVPKKMTREILYKEIGKMQKELNEINEKLNYMHGRMCAILSYNTRSKKGKK